MGWQKVGNQRYYYERKKVDGVVVTTYVGRGPVAELKARIDAEAAAAQREEDRRDREVIRQYKERDLVVDSIQKAFDAEVKEFIETQLSSLGLHYRNGKWRKARKKPSPEIEKVLALKREVLSKKPWIK